MAASIIRQLLVPAPGAGLWWNLVIHGLRAGALALTTPLLEEWQAKRELETLERQHAEQLREIRRRQADIAQRRMLAEEASQRYETFQRAMAERRMWQTLQRDWDIAGQRLEYEERRRQEQAARDEQIQARIQARDEAIRADIERREQARLQEQRRRDAQRLQWEMIKERHRRQEQLARLALEQERIRLQREREEAIRERLREQDEARRWTAYPLTAERLLPKATIVRRVRNQGGRALVRAQDAIAAGAIQAVRCEGGRGCEVLTQEGRWERRRSTWDAATGMIMPEITTRDLQLGGVIPIRRTLRIIGYRPA